MQDPVYGIGFFLALATVFAGACAVAIKIGWVPHWSGRIKKNEQPFVFRVAVTCLGGIALVGLAFAARLWWWMLNK